MLKHFEHIGMATGNLDRFMAFYVDLLGMDLFLRKKTSSGNAEVAFLTVGGRMVLEVFAPGSPMTGPARDLPTDEVGIRHIALAFDSVDEIYNRLMAAGVESVEKPRDAFNKEILARVAFVKDPDGNIIELINH